MKRNNWLILITSALLTTLFLMAAQPSKKKRSDLEKERAQKLKKIKETNKVLEDTKQKKTATLSQLNVLNQTIQEQETVIKSIYTEVDILQQEISEQTIIIQTLENDIKALKEEYARLVYQDYKYKDGFDKLLYLLSSDNFSQLVRRQAYFKHYEVARVQQMKEIEDISWAAQTYKSQLDANKSDKEVLIQAKTIESQNLVQVKEQQQVVLKKLNSKESQLEKELESNKKAVKDLEKTIKDLIALERKKALEESRKSSPSNSPNSNNTNKSVPTYSEETIKLSGSFEANMGKLPWPVQTGRVSQRFGRQPHPVLKGVFVDNLGIDILTTQNETVKAVFGGKVVTVTEVPGMHTIVMIQHGQYFTVYAKLKSASVSPGQQVLAKQVIGTVYTDKDGDSELQFQIWNNETKLNPETWLRNR
ncbi:MAG: peptidoglycan DD-metalloendopeptidase family protein [Cytophagaceae bacterium]